MSSPSYSIDSQKVIINNYHPVIVAAFTNPTSSAQQQISTGPATLKFQWHFKNHKGEWQAVNERVNNILEDGYDEYLEFVSENIKSVEFYGAEDEDLDDEPDYVYYTVGDNDYEVSFGDGKSDHPAGYQQRNTKTNVTRDLLRVTAD